MAFVLRYVGVNAEPDLTKVKNLGWLLRNWTAVKRFTIAEAIDDRGACVLIAHLKTGGAYLTTFASYGVCLNFLHRPVFYGLEIADRVFDPSSQYPRMLTILEENRGAYINSTPGRRVWTRQG